MPERAWMRRGIATTQSSMFMPGRCPPLLHHIDGFGHMFRQIKGQIRYQLVGCVGDVPYRSLADRQEASGNRPSNSTSTVESQKPVGPGRLRGLRLSPPAVHL